MTKAEEIARGLFNCLSRDRYLTEAEHNRIVAAIHEYGALVRKQDSEVCQINADFFGNGPDSELHPLHARERDTYSNCAAAIAAKELP